MSEERKSPIKNLPVRQPGQSIREQLDDFLDEKILLWILAPGVAAIVAVVEWIGYLSNVPRAPKFYTGLALLLVVVSFFRIRKALRQGRALRLGQTGEEAVGQYLEEKLRPLGCQVLHDIPGDGFNVDHVVIGPTGVFSVETKTHSKPAHGIHNVKFDGEKVTVNGFVPERDPVVQAKAQAHWLSELIEKTTGKRFPVQPILLYPGWFVEKMPERSDIWVLNEKVLPVFVKNARSHLAPDDVSLVTFHLKRYVIAKTEELRNKR